MSPSTSRCLRRGCAASSVRSTRDRPYGGKRAAGPRTGGLGAPLVSLEEASQHTPDEALLRARREEILDIDLVYVLFTSGSTGTPKGIVIPHRAILDFTA